MTADDQAPFFPDVPAHVLASVFEKDYYFIALAAGDMTTQSNIAPGETE